MLYGRRGTAGSGISATTSLRPVNTGAREIVNVLVSKVQAYSAPPKFEQELREQELSDALTARRGCGKFCYIFKRETFSYSHLASLCQVVYMDNLHGWLQTLLERARV